MNAKEWDQPVSPMGGGARYWRLYILNNWGALWGMGFSRMEFKGSPADAAPSLCAAIKTEAACIYAGTERAAHFSAAVTASSCGWCSETKVPCSAAGATWSAWISLTPTYYVCAY